MSFAYHAMHLMEDHTDRWVPHGQPFQASPEPSLSTSSPDTQSGRWSFARLNQPRNTAVTNENTTTTAPEDTLGAIVSPSTRPACVLCETLHDGPLGGLCRPCFQRHVGARQPQHNAKARVRRDPIYMVDVDGAPIVLLQTNKPGQTVKMLAADLADLTERGFSDQITIHFDAKSGFSYANTTFSGASSTGVSLSRLIARAGRNRRVTYRDGDRLNLRANNLQLVKGFGKAVLLPKKNAANVACNTTSERS